MYRAELAGIRVARHALIILSKALLALNCTAENGMRVIQLYHCAFWGSAVAQRPHDSLPSSTVAGEG